MKAYLAGGCEERGPHEHIEQSERIHLDAGARRLMAFGTKNQEHYLKVFLAGNVTPMWNEQACLDGGLQRRLQSFEQRDELVARLPLYKTSRVEVMLDSGAFSAHSRGIAIDLQEYADFIIKYAGVFDVVANLDVIPGPPGSKELNHDPKEAERAAEMGRRNWLDLRVALKPVGIKPIPVYHLGEPIKWLKKMIDETDYIGLGGLRHGTLDDKVEWLDSLMPHLTDGKGRPKVKFHGFAATSLEIMRRYPFQSVDSTTWLQVSKRGAILIPPGILGSRQREIVFSDDPRSLHNLSREHFRSLATVEREAMMCYLASKGVTPRMLAEKFCRSCGKTVKKKPLTCCRTPEASSDYTHRNVMNIHAWRSIERSLEPRPWRR